MAAPESHGHGILKHAFTLARRLLHQRGSLPAGPQYVLQHLKRMQHQTAGLPWNARSDASRVALLRDLEEPATSMRPGE